MKHFLNAMVPLYRNSQKKLCEIFESFKSFDSFGLYEFTFHDFTMRTGPFLSKDIDGEIVYYNEAEKSVFVEELGSRTLDKLCAIRNALIYSGQGGVEFHLFLIVFHFSFSHLFFSK